MKPRANRPVSIRKQMNRLVFTFAVLMLVLLITVLSTLAMYQSQYDSLMNNVTTASEFNQDFKDSIDLEMYYFVIESQYSQGLPVSEVQDAQALAQNLRSTTTQKDSLRAITSVLDLCQTLEAKIYQIEDTQDYDERQEQLENNIYVLTSLIEEYMYNYLYCESVQLNALQDQMTRQIFIEMVLVVIIIGILLLLLTRYTLRLSRSITDPIVQLSHRMEEVSGGDITPHEPVTARAYELSTLSTGLEEMVSRINQLLQESTEKQARLRQAELALLQAQINPHFLYNTMDTIIWLIEAEKCPEAVEMVSNLSTFFRHSLSKGKDIISLGDELQQVRSYLQIQRVRYQDIMTYSIEVDPSLTSVRLPKLTLQPLVENALYHGIKLKRGQGHILVTGCAEGEDVLLRVRDNGIGMTPERLTQLREAMEQGERVGFGLSTVHERLRLLFGPEYGLSIESVPGEGTEITVRIPRAPKEATP